MNKKSLKIMLSLLLVFILSFSLISCSSYNNQNTDISAKPGGHPTMPSPENMAVKENAGDSVLQNNSDINNNDKIIKNGDISLESLDNTKAFEKIKELAKEFKGYVENYSKSKQYLNITLKVPSEKLEEAIKALGDNFNIKSENIYTENVSEYYYDSSSRLNNLKAREERLLELLKEAKDLSQVLEIEKSLSEVRYEIESITGILKSIDKKVFYSTLNLNINEVFSYSSVSNNPKTFGEKLSQVFKNSFEVFGSFCVNIFYGLIYVIPFLIVIVIILLIVFFIIKKKKTKKNKSNDE